MKNLFKGFEQTRWRSRAHQAWFRLCSVCLSVYIGYISYFAHSRAFTGAGTTIVSFALWLLVSAAVWVLLDAGSGVLANCAPKPKKTSEKIDLRIFVLALVIALGVFGFAFAACFPGGVSYDASNQWRQMQSGEFNNWHPLMHTLMIWLVTRVWQSYPFVLLVQVAAFAVSLAWLTAVLHKHGVPAWLALAAEMFAALTPLVRNALMYVGKDSAMTIGVLWLTGWTIEILFTRGQWLKKPLHAVLFGLVLAVTTLVRHNAMMWTYALIACVFFCFKASRKAAALSAALMIAALVLIQGPLYGMLNVVYPENFVDESMGIPMTILGDVKQREPEKLDADTSAFLAQLASDEEWQTVYHLHNYNSIKFTFDREYVARKPLGEILSMTARTAAAAPRTAFEAINGLTDLVWDVTGQNEGNTSVRNSGDIPEAAYKSARLNALGGRFVQAFDWLAGLPVIRWVMQNIGVQLLLLLLTALWALRRHGVQVLALVLPTLLYDLGTMMLLASNDARFFQFSMTISIPVILILMFLQKEEGVCS